MHSHYTTDSPQNGIPFDFSPDDFAEALQFVPLRETDAEVTAHFDLNEVHQRLALTHASSNDGSRLYIEHQLQPMVAELERCLALLKTCPHDPLRFRWPKRDPNWESRVEAIKRAWPIKRFMTDLLAAELISAGAGRWKCRCPLPAHQDCTPSFLVTEQNDFGWCFGCGRGRNVIKLTQLALNLDSFTAALRRLETEPTGATV